MSAPRLPILRAVPARARPLTTRQAEVLDLIRQIHEATGEGVPRALVARRLGVDPMTIQGHANALARKGLLRSAGAPFVPVDPFAATTRQLDS